MKSIQYDLCFSIGRLCGCAMYLRNCHLPHIAGPFDWLQGRESLLDRVALIENDCTGWLKKENLEILPENFRSHIVYDKGSELTFRHDFPKHLSVEASLANVKERYARRIKRFYEKIANSRHVALVYLSVGETKISDTDACEALRRLRSKLGSHVDLFLVLNDPVMMRHTKTESSPTDGVKIYRVNMTGEGGKISNVIQGDQRKDVEKILTGIIKLTPNILCQIYWNDFKRRLQKIIRNIQAAFCVSREKRRLVRMSNGQEGQFL